MRRTDKLALILLLAMMSFGACLCGDGGLGVIPDAGEDAGPEPEEDAGPEPEPPVYPLKPGDQVEVIAVGARVEPCELQGDCDRVIEASYTVDSVTIGEDGTWTVQADYTYAMRKANASYDEISRLFVSRIAPFGILEAVNDNQASTEPATFFTDRAPTDTVTANGFPFFHYESEYANLPGSAFQRAVADMLLRIKEIDPDAEVETQPAAAKLEAFFRDDLGAQTYLHKIRVELHPMGMMCDWVEEVIPWEEGMNRAQSSFQGQTPPIAASFNGIRVRRDGEAYNCSCFSRDCRAPGDGGGYKCLNVENPDDEPSPDFCSQ